MCLRYAFTVTDREAVKKRFGLKSAASLKPRFNIAPTQQVPVIFNDSPEALSGAFWGMPAKWKDEAGEGRLLFNARSESIDTKPSFRESFEKSRCLIVADSFYEWMQPAKRPFRVSMKDNSLFAFAGIYADWNEDEGTRACCMITTAPNALVSGVHDRMPAILPRELEKDWLTMGGKEAKQALQPYPEEKMQMQEISKAINSSKRDSEELVKPVSKKNTLSEYLK